MKLPAESVTFPLLIPDMRSLFVSLVNDSIDVKIIYFVYALMMKQIYFQEQCSYSDVATIL